MFSTQNFKRSVINTLLIFLHTSVTPSNLKIGLEMPTAFKKLAKKLRRG